MNIFTNILRYLVILPLLTASCSFRVAPAPPEEPVVQKGSSYQALLGKSLTDKVVANFIASNHCMSAEQFQLCSDIGIALLIASDQVVKTVYLYLNDVKGFASYQGELPFGLKFYDTMGAAEYKLNKKGIGSDGLPDLGDSPDHLHYWANYQQVHMTIIYNSPSPEDEDATIYAILVSQ